MSDSLQSWPVVATIFATMTEGVRLSAVALLLCSGGLFSAACGGGDSATIDSKEITLTGSALREFVGTLLLTSEDVPAVLADAPEEEWETDPESQEAAFLADFNLAEPGWLGTLGRPFFARGPEGRTFTVINTALAFRTASGAKATLDFVKETDVNESGEAFVEASSATSYEVEDFEIDVGDDAWSLVLVGPAVVDGSPEELTSAMIMFRRGPIVAAVGMVGFVELDESFLRELVRKLDERIREGLDEL